MLRRRILASAMASVMAIGSVAVVASAEDAAVATAQVKTKADLEAYVKSFDKFREDGIYDYGSKSAERFLSTIEYADNVLADSKSGVDEYTVAYAMLESVYNSLKIYSSSELKALIDSCKTTYETDNIMNEDLQDLIYDEDTFSAFVTAYEDAEDFLSSSDSRIITDAYEVLAAAKADLKALDVVTKSQYRSALKNFETIISREKDYDSWRRGTLPDGWVDGISNWWVFRDGKMYGKTIDFDTLLEYTTGDSFTHTYDWGTAYGIEQMYEDKTVADSITDFVNDNYDKFNEVKTANKTTNKDIVNGYKSAVSAYNLFNAWTADDTERATKSSVTKLLNQYHSQLVAKYATTAAENLYINVNANWVEQDDGTWKNVTTTAADWADVTNKYYGASLKNEGKKTTIYVDEDGYAHYESWGVDTTKYTKQQSVAKGTDILKYIKVTSADVPAADADLKEALKIAEDYIADKFDATVYGLDESGKVAKAAGSAAEWTLVYRNLKYALEDMFNGSAAKTHTRAEVVELIDKAYTLAEATGDAAIFADNHEAMVTKRQAALAWVREANKDKGYKDGDFVDDLTATDVYNNLFGAYDALDKQLAKYKYSYEEVYMTIAEVADQIDSGDLTATDALVAALDKAAYTLAVVEAKDEDNEAFNGAREFQKFNRVHTDADNQTASEKALQAAYEALLAEVKAQEEPAVVVGDFNGDGVADQRDAAIILKKVVDGETIDIAIGDFDGDGYADQRDASAILKHVVNQA